MKSNFRYLMKNTGLLFIGNFSSKILVFLLVPLYTRFLSTEEYGSYDLLYTTVQMLLPILSLNIIDSVVRFAINETEEKRRLAFTSGIKYTVISYLLFIAGAWIVADVFQNVLIREFQLPFILLYIGYALYQLTIQFARGLEDVLGISLAGMLSTLVMLGLNIYFLVVLKIGLKGYFYAHVLATVIPAVFLFLRGRMYRYLDVKHLLHFHSYEKDMLRYCIPLIFTTLSWYINNTADRYTVTWLRGLSANGVYAVAYKIPAILNAVQVIFIQAWQLSAIREFGSKENTGFYRKIYQGCQAVMVLLCSALILGTRIAARLLFAKEFYAAWVYVPVLLIYIVFNTLSGTIGGVFSAAKDTGSCAKSAVAGAIVNVLLNFPLIYWYGAQGAAVATLISSVVIWAMRMYYSRRHIDLHLNHAKYLIEYGVLVLQAILMIYVQGVVGYLMQGGLCGVLLILNLKEIKEVAK